MSQVSIVEMSAVVIAEYHNPSILHTSFLKCEEIIPADWEPLNDGSFTTPGVSAVSFSNGMRITVEQNKLQVLDADPQTGGRASFIMDVCTKYVQKLPHVSYKAVGINVTGFIARPDADSYFITHFLGKRSFDLGPTRLTSGSCRLHYDLDGLQLGIMISPARQQETGEEGLLIKSNYHTEIILAEAAASRYEQCINALKKTELHKRHYLDTMPLLLNTGA